MKAALPVLAFALTLSASCKSHEPVGGQIHDKIEITALVTAVDLPKRELTLKDKEGGEVVVEASEGVRNLNQVKVGDEVAVTYAEQVSWKVLPAGSASPGVATDAKMDRAAPGAKPGGKLGR